MEYCNMIIVKVGELHLKGQNRPFFERTLIHNIKLALKGCAVHPTPARRPENNHQPEPYFRLQYSPAAPGGGAGDFKPHLWHSRPFPGQGN